MKQWTSTRNEFYKEYSRKKMYYIVFALFRYWVNCLRVSFLFSSYLSSCFHSQHILSDSVQYPSESSTKHMIRAIENTIGKEQGDYLILALPSTYTLQFCLDLGRKTFQELMSINDRILLNFSDIKQSKIFYPYKPTEFNALQVNHSSWIFK